MFLLIIDQETPFRIQSISTFVDYMSEHPYYLGQSMFLCFIAKYGVIRMDLR